MISRWQGTYIRVDVYVHVSCMQIRKRPELSSLDIRGWKSTESAERLLRRSRGRPTHVSSPSSWPVHQRNLRGPEVQEPEGRERDARKRRREVSPAKIDRTTRLDPFHARPLSPHPVVSISTRPPTSANSAASQSSRGARPAGAGYRSRGRRTSESVASAPLTRTTARRTTAAGGDEANISWSSSNDLGS